MNGPTPITPKKDSQVDLEDFVKVAAEASARTRSMLVIIVTACVLLATGVLNSGLSPWSLARREAAQKSPEFWRKLLIDTSGLKRFPLSIKKKKLRAEIGKLNLEVIKHEYLAHRRSVLENVATIKIPFFGMSFDINDLVLVGGIGLSIGMILLRLSLGTELRSVRLCFKYADDKFSSNPEEKRWAYELLAATQVLTRPRSMGQSDLSPHAAKLVSMGSKMFYFFPVFVLSLAVANDLYSMHVAVDLNQVVRARFGTTFGILFVFIVFALGVWSYRATIVLDKLWAARADLLSIKQFAAPAVYTDAHNFGRAGRSAYRTGYLAFAVALIACAFSVFEVTTWITGIVFVTAASISIYSIMRHESFGKHEQSGENFGTSWLAWAALVLPLVWILSLSAFAV